MSTLGKQAKTLSKKQVEVVLAWLESRPRNRLRNRVMFLLSVKAGLRAKEISELLWTDVLDSSGEVGDLLSVRSSVSKGGYGGRRVPLADGLRDALTDLQKFGGASGYVVESERGEKLDRQSVVDWFGRLYRDTGVQGGSSHSGRRTFITNVARSIGRFGGSLRDVQALAGHASIQTTQRYIEVSEDATRKVVNAI